MSIWSCRCSALGHEGSLETSFRPSELQRRTIGVRNCCDDVVAWPADADWLTTGVDDWKHQMYAHSSPPSTGEHDSGGIDKLWLRAYTEHVDRCPANVAQSGADQTNRGQTSVCRWWLVLQHSAHWSLSVINRGDPASAIIISSLLLYNRFLTSFLSVSIPLCSQLPVWVQQSHHHLWNHVSVDFFSCLLLVYNTYLILPWVISCKIPSCLKNMKCKTPVKMSPQTKQHQTFYRPDALPVIQPTVSQHWRKTQL